MSHHRWIVAAGTALLLLFGCTRTLAQEFRFSGQIRPRLETRDLTDVSGDGGGFVSMRTRLGVGVAINPSLRAFAQIQDVRVWGSEFSTTDGDADQLDLHQAWAEIGAADETTLRFGRQEARYGNERLIGTLDWVQQGRSFDGLRATHPVGRARVDGFLFQVAEEVAGFADDGAIGGLYATMPFGEHAAEAFGLWNTDAGSSQGTAGGRVVARLGRALARLEGAAQFGERASQDVSAHLLSAEIAIDVVDGVVIGALYDRLSGDDDPLDGELHVFDTLYGTNHKFYGYADVFTNIPAHTGGRGLQDVALRGAWQPIQPLTLTLDAHRFLAAAGDGMSDEHFGDEIDLVATWRTSQNVGVSGGVFRFDPADGFGDIGRIEETLVATYVAVDVTF
ncbi:MAG TPA: alginate export family protein [Longimicrobiales bacterium]